MSWPFVSRERYDELLERLKESEAERKSLLAAVLKPSAPEVEQVVEDDRDDILAARPSRRDMIKRAESHRNGRVKTSG